MREKLVNRALNPLLATLPPWVEGYRPQQIDAVLEILDAYQSGQRVVVLDAPTGTGKTLIAETVRRMLRANGLYICSSKGLQDQFANDYPYAAILKGRSNYPTELFARDFNPGDWNSVSCDDCQWSQPHPSCKFCTSKKSCPYEIDKDAALRSSLAVINYAYALAEFNGPGRFKDCEFSILDEADTLEGWIMGFVETHVGRRRMEKYGWAPPKVTVQEDWTRWISERLIDIPIIQKSLRPYSSIKDNKEMKSLSGLQERLRALDDAESRWVFTGREGEAAWKPVRVADNKMMYPHLQRALLMSATVISSSSLLVSTGYTGPYSTVTLDSSFPVKNRPVIIRPVANMSHKNDGKGYDALSEAIMEILRTSGRDDRVLIHCVSYSLARELAARIRTDRCLISQTSASDREDCLNRYLTSNGAVLISPSLGRGVDLPDKACRVQIIAKIPFPNLGDRQVAARAYSGTEGKTWYTVETVRTIVQMCGRAVRSAEDHATTYILDSQFQSVLWSKARHLFPKWWVKALQWQRV